MNLFILDTDPNIAAVYNCDIHVRKIILEAASCMCAAHWEYGFKNLSNAPGPLQRGQYRGRTHHNNHITRWVRESVKNYEWTYAHALALCDQYTLRSRHGRRHASEPIIRWLGDNIPPIELEEQTPFRQAVAPECYHSNPVVAYWVYYVACKRHLARWTNQVPEWFTYLTSKLLDGAKIEDLLGEADSFINNSFEVSNA